MLQHLTLWLCLLGAALATCERKHISIDVLSRVLSENITRWSNLVVDCLALIIVGILAYYGFIFLHDEQLSDAVLIGSVPLWWAKAIIPYGFVLIGIHMLLQIGIHLMGGEHTSKYCRRRIGLMGLIIGIGLVGFALFGGALFVLLGGASIIGYAMAGEPISTILIDFNRLTRNSTILVIRSSLLRGI